MRTYTALKQMTQFHFRTLMRNKIAFFFNLVMPIIFLVVFGMMYGGSSSEIPVGLVDQDGGPTAQLVRQALDQSGLYKVTVGEEADLLRKLDMGSVRAVVILRPGVSETVAQQRGPAPVTIRWDPTSQSSSAARGSLEFMLGGIEANARGAAPLLQVEVAELEATTRLNIYDFMMPGMLTYMLLNAGVVSVAISLAFQRQTGTMRHMFSTPLSMSVWMTGRILANLVLSLLQLALIWGVGLALFEVQLPANLVGTLLLLFLCALAGLGIGMAIGTLTRNADAAMPVSLVISMALTFLGNAMMPLDGAPQIIQSLMRFMPSYYMTHALQFVMMKGQSLMVVPVDLLILLVTAAAGFTLAGWRLRKLFVVSA